MSFIEVQSAVRSTSQKQYAHAAAVFQKAGVKWPTHAERALFLAYGYLRGVPYRVMEPTASPLFESLGHIDKSFMEQIAVLVSWADKDHPITKGTIEAWMDQPEPAAHFAKRTAREEAAKKARAERYEQYAKTRSTQKVA